MANRIKKGDQVLVTTGKDKGKQGEVVRVDGDRVVVSNVNLVKRHTKPNPQAGVAGGVVEREALDPHFQRHAAQPRHRQGRAHRFQGPGGWTQTACVPLQW